MVKTVKEDIENPDAEYAHLLKVLGESSETRFWYDFLINRYGTSASMMEFGAGAGNLSIPLARAGINVAAVEIDPHSVQNLKDSAPDNLEVVSDRVEAIDLARDFDLVLSKSCLLFMPRTDIRGFFNSAAKHLKPSSLFLAEVPDESWLKEKAFLDNGRQQVVARYDQGTDLWSMEAIYKTGEGTSYKLTEVYNIIDDERINEIAQEHCLRLSPENEVKLNPITKYLAFERVQ